VKTVREGNTLVIFPEGRITVTGALMKVFDGPGMVADKADAPVIPVRIDGAQYTRFSHLKGKVRLRAFPKVKLTVLPPRRFELPQEMTARQRRAVAGRQLYDVMSDMIFATSDANRTLYEALLDAKAIHGGKSLVVEDIKREPLSYSRLIVGTKALGRVFKRRTAPGEAVGLLLPNVNGVVVSFFALQGLGRVPAMLNYTAGLTNLKAACTAAEVKTVVTARAFVTQAKLQDVIAGLEADGRRVLYLEDIAATIGAGAKLRALIGARFARRLLARRKLSPDAPAVILFTSGSEGLPKGVVLTHRNLLSNCLQLAARIDFNSTDIVLNALPVFHSFGLTGGTLLPILNGIRTLLYPSPLHYRIVPALAYDSNATILFGTDTFLAGYARMAHSYDFYALRYIFAGAERVRDETRKTYADKFGLRILEGYGATEAGPVIAVNTPMHFKPGTVGRLLPGIEARLDEVPGIDNGKRLAIRGPNIMAGYLKADLPGVLQPPEGGWHDSGDIVTIDTEGFITIRGRAKRFAKIGGEMVSLPAVEGYAAALWPNADHAVVTRPDPKKGEQLVLFTTAAGATAAALQHWARGNGVTELAVPKDVRVVDALPVLGTGKLDYVTMGAMAAGLEVRAAPREQTLSPSGERVAERSEAGRGEWSRCPPLPPPLAAPSPLKGRGLSLLRFRPRFRREPHQRLAGLDARALADPFGERETLGREDDDGRAVLEPAHFLPLRHFGQAGDAVDDAEFRAAAPALGAQRARLVDAAAAAVDLVPRALGVQVAERVDEIEADARDQDRGHRHEHDRMARRLQLAMDQRPLILAEQFLDPLQRDRVHVPGVAGNVGDAVDDQVVRRVEAVIVGRGQADGRKTAVAEGAAVRFVAEQVPQRIGKSLHLVEMVTVNLPAGADDAVAGRGENLGVRIDRPSAGLQLADEDVVHRPVFGRRSFRQIEIGEQLPGGDGGLAHHRIFDLGEPAHEAGREPARQTIGQEEVQILLSDKSVEGRAHRQGSTIPYRLISERRPLPREIAPIASLSRR
jgi:acyl-CoA synthetase (AMP-forming)/AMP-acid ligase II